MSEENINIYDIPVSALSLSRKKLQMLLDPEKLLSTDEGFERDWQGLAQLTGICPQAIASIALKPSPTEVILNLWKDSSIGLLLEYLRKMERCDIIEDLEEENYLDQDIANFIRRQNNAGISTSSLVNEIDKEIITIDDVIRLENGLPPQTYDAFLLYSEEDCDFAYELISRMENDYNFKICYKERDFIKGLTFEQDAIIKLISERCSRLIIIISNNFLKIEANTFIVNFAQDIALKKKRRIVIPCLIEKCNLPLYLAFLPILDYTKSGKLFDFWVRLRDSLRAPKINIQSRSEITEIPEISEQPHQEQTRGIPQSLKLENIMKPLSEIESKQFSKLEDITRPLKENSQLSLSLPDVPNHSLENVELYQDSSSIKKPLLNFKLSRKKIKKFFKKSKHNNQQAVELKI